MRRALGLALALAAILAPAARADDRVVPFSVPLEIPPVLTGSDLDIPMRETEAQILPGKKTKLWTYGGSFPGPTIRRPSGTVTRVRFRNELPAQAGPMSVHLHGGHVAASEDGQPHEDAAAGGPGLLIPPGGERQYRWDHVEDGRDEPAAFQWYHDHLMDVTGRNVWRGLAGMFILDDPAERALPLPKGEFDVPLMVVDRSFDEDNQMAYPEPVPAITGLIPGTGKPPSDEVTGDVILVNGKPQPYFEVAARRYRLRLLNASNFRTFDFSLADGRPMTQIATESGLLERPVERQSIALGPAERAEVVVDFAGMTGKTLVLRSQAGDVMQFRVVREAPDDSSVPASLRPMPPLEASSTPDRSFEFGLGADPEKQRLAWTINQRVFDHERADAEPRAGETETWQFTNLTSSGVPHYVHVHATDFRVVSRNGEPPPPWESGFKETVQVDPNETVVVQARFTDHLGAFVFHCHMLEHEDNGMMGRFVVRGEGDPPSGREDDGSPQSVTLPTAPAQGGADAPSRGVEPADDGGALDVAFVRPPSALRNGARVRLRLRVRNVSRRAIAGVRAELRIPRDFRAVRGRRHVRVKRVALPVGRLAPGASRTVAATIGTPARFPFRRVRFHAAATGAGEVARTELEYVVSRQRTKRAKGRAASAGGLICRLDT